jgi:hypothetical protein
MEHYENFEQTPEERADFEKMVREDRKNELRKLAFNKHLHQETYYLINKQFEKEIERHPTKNVPIKIFDEIPDDTPLYKGGAIEDDFGVRCHFNQIRSLDKPEPVVIHIVNYDTNTSSDEKKMYVPTDIIGAFRYVLNKEKISHLLGPLRYKRV